MNDIRCILSSYKTVSPRGVERTINEFRTKSGEYVTQIVTKLDNCGTEGIREIEKDFLGIPKQVVDNVFGRREVYVRAYPERPQGVFQYTEDNMRTYFPNISFESLCQY